MFTLESRVLLLLLLVAGTCGCGEDMRDQAYLRPLAASSFYSDGRGSRDLMPGTVARGHLHPDHATFTGLVNGRPVEQFPFPITTAVLARGQERYEIYCTPCHGRDGGGDGVTARFGTRRPGSFHTAALRAAPPGHLFDVITRGWGMMYDQAYQIPVNDRWAIVAYIHALQLSQYIPAADLPAADRARLEAGR